jgi:hypothetical protein
MGGEIELTPAKEAILVPVLVDTDVTIVQLSLEVVQFRPALADCARQFATCTILGITC